MSIFPNVVTSLLCIWQRLQWLDRVITTVLKKTSQLYLMCHYHSLMKAAMVLPIHLINPSSTLASAFQQGCY